jgi:hypothetical protein
LRGWPKPALDDEERDKKCLEVLGEEKFHLINYFSSRARLCVENLVSAGVVLPSLLLVMFNICLFAQPG